MIENNQLKIGKAYMSTDYGVILVRRVSVNGILIIFIDTYGVQYKRSYLALKDCMDSDRETFDRLFRKNHKGEKVVITKKNYYYIRNKYDYNY